MSWLVPQKTCEIASGTRKVALAPGKSLINWIRLSNSQHLASQQLDGIDETELMKHDKVDNCWILLFNNVYDITVYLEYHPGGVDELMRVAGTDATNLFNELHQWVNYGDMLRSCRVGPFTGDRGKLKQPLPSPDAN